MLIKMLIITTTTIIVIRIIEEKKNKKCTYFSRRDFNNIVTDLCYDKLDITHKQKSEHNILFYGGCECRRHTCTDLHY